VPLCSVIPTGRRGSVVSDFTALTDQSTVGALKGGPPVSPATTGTIGGHEGQHFRLARCIQLSNLLAAFCTPTRRPLREPNRDLQPPVLRRQGFSLGQFRRTDWGACSSVSGCQRADSILRVAPASLVVFPRRCRVGWGVL